MNVNLINPFIIALGEVLPQLGFQSIIRGNLAVKEEMVDSRGVTVLIGMTNQIKGNVAYNMTEQTAKKLASTMMMGMPVAEMDSMAQSAISELVNMVTANATMNFEKQGLIVDISPPSLVMGNDFKAKLSHGKFLSLELLVDSETLELNVKLES